MPTFAKLAAALFFAFVGYGVALTYNLHLPDNVSLPNLPFLMAGLGVLLGWLSMGPQAGRGYRDSAGYGMRTTVLTAFLAMVLVAGQNMLRRSMGEMYRSDPLAAVQDLPNLLLKYGQHMMHRDVLVFIALGGILGGLVVEAVARRWG